MDDEPRRQTTSAWTDIDIGSVSRAFRLSWIGTRSLCLVTAITGFYLLLVEVVVSGLSHSGFKAFYWFSPILAVQFAVMSALTGKFRPQLIAGALTAAYAVYAAIVSFYGYEFGSRIGWASGEQPYMQVFSDTRLVAAALTPFLLVSCWLLFANVKAYNARVTRIIGETRSTVYNESTRLSVMGDVRTREYASIIAGALFASPYPIVSALDLLPESVKQVSGPTFLGGVIAMMSGLSVVMALGIREMVRRLRPNADQQLTRDARKPIMFLRSFRDEGARVPPTDLFTRLQLRRLRLEEVLAAELSRVGPCVAIGRPGERLPELGAFRKYVEDWQAAVLEWTGSARVIVVIAGATPSVGWELRQLAAENTLHKLLIVFPAGDSASTASRWSQIHHCLEGTEHGAILKNVDLSDIRALHFPEQGGPILIRSRTSTQSDYELAVIVSLFGMFCAGSRREPSARVPVRVRGAGSDGV
jgi:hypothetical protein